EGDREHHEEQTRKKARIAEDRAARRARHVAVRARQRGARPHQPEEEREARRSTHAETLNPCPPRQRPPSRPAPSSGCVALREREFITPVRGTPSGAAPRSLDTGDGRAQCSSNSASITSSPRSLGPGCGGG